MAKPNSFQRFSDQLQQGDHDQAAREVFGRYVDRLILLARSRLDPKIRQKEDPEDVVQSVFRSFFARQTAGQFRLTDWDSLWALLAMLTVRKCARRRERWRSQKRAVDREVPVGVPHGLTGAEWGIIGAEPLPEDATVLAETLELLLQPLDSRERTIVALRLQGKQDAEIAREVGRSRYTVQAVLRRLNHKLRQQIERGDVDS